MEMSLELTVQYKTYKLMEVYYINNNMGDNFLCNLLNFGMKFQH